jgi:PPP family 3-phenylpropionic acid transporter
MLKLFYVCFFVTTGVSVPFFPAYLRQVGLSGRQVSVMLAIPPALQLVVPLLWGWLADRTRRPDRILRGLCLGAFLASLPVIFVRSMPALFAVCFAQQLFAVSITALADSLAIESSRRTGRYGSIRATGSASFVSICLLVGWWLDLRGVHGGDALVPILISTGFALSFLAALNLKGQAAKERPHARDVGRLLADRGFLLLLVIAGLHWAALVPYHGFFGILVHDRGFPSKVTSYAFFAGVGAEIVVFLTFARLRLRYTRSQLLAASFAVSAVRWVLVARVHSAPLMVALQVTHGLTFGVFWATAMAWMVDCVPSKLRATGQVLFTTVTGIGSMTGLLIAGALYDATGGANLAFNLAGILDLVPLALVLLFLRRQGHAVTAGGLVPPSPLRTTQVE